MNAIGRRVNPPRSSGGSAPDIAPKSKKKEPPQPKPKPAPEAVQEDTRSPLQKLMDKFS